MSLLNLGKVYRIKAHDSIANQGFYKRKGKGRPAQQGTKLNRLKETTVTTGGLEEVIYTFHTHSFIDSFEYFTTFSTFC
jgi:hypothetical protein